MKGIGPILKKNRVERGITFEDIENATKIRAKYLQAIEDENFDLLPGAVYAKGFVNTYVRYLNIGNRPDVVEILKTPMPSEGLQEKEEIVHEIAPRGASRAQATKQRAPKPKTKATPVEEQPLTKKKYLIIGLSAVALLLLFGIQMFFNSQFKEPDDQVVPPPIVGDLPTDPDVEPTPVEPVEPEAPPAVEYEGLVMTVEIVDLNPNATDKCWIRATVDNKMLFEETLSQGAVKEITGTEKISLRLGNGSVVKLTLNGQDLGMASTGTSVVNKDFTLESLNELPQN